MSKRWAVVSIGTNSTRVLLADVEPQRARVAFARSIGTRIGEGLAQEGSLGEEPMRRTIDAITELARGIRGHYVRLFAVGTSALRRAGNEAEFAQRVHEVLGVPLRILSGEEEAAASYRGALTAFGDLRGERVGVVDTGGGSTEYAVGTSSVPESVVSCEIGAVRLSEAVPALCGRSGAVDAKAVEEAGAMAREALRPLAAYPAAARVALVGGSATTTAAIAHRRLWPARGGSLTRAELRRTLERLLAMTLDERKRVPGMRRQRADILPAGIVVLDAALEALQHDAALATTADLLLGILLQERDAAGQPPRMAAGSDSRREFR